MANPRMPSTFLSSLLAAVVLALLSSSNSSLVPSTTILRYHKGPLLTSPINVYVIWYGSFPSSHKSTISSFFSSFSSPHVDLPGKSTVSTWWKTTQSYKDSGGKPVSSTVHLAGEVVDAACSIGKSIKRTDIARLVSGALAKRSFPYDAGAVYLVLTGSDVGVERFCMGSCGFHAEEPVFGGKTAVVAHVGDPGSQCPGLCAWPFAAPAYGPPGPPLVAPNGVSADGMVMNIAAILAGASTNPKGDGYYQGNKLAPLEAVTACAGIFGNGAYPGYPGELAVDEASKASFNARGVGGKMYLLPAMWDARSRTCKALA